MLVPHKIAFIKIREGKNIRLSLVVSSPCFMECITSKSTSMILVRFIFLIHTCGIDRLYIINEQLRKQEIMGSPFNTKAKKLTSYIIRKNDIHLANILVP